MDYLSMLIMYILERIYLAQAQANSRLIRQQAHKSVSLLNENFYNLIYHFFYINIINFFFFCSKKKKISFDE